VVKAGDVVKVKVLEVHIARKRIALTMRLSDEAAPRTDAVKVSRGGTPPPKAPRSTQRSPDPSGAMAAAFAKLKR